MHVHYISQEQVIVHLRGLAERLHKMKELMPNLILAIGSSGDDLATWLLTVDPGLQESMYPYVVDVIRGTTEVEFGNEEVKELINGKHVLILDGFVKTGEKMSVIARTSRELGAATVCSYGVGVRRSTSFVPSMWGLLVDDHELVIIPRNDRDAQEKNQLPPSELAERTPTLPVHLRRLSTFDLIQQPLVTGDKKLDVINWAGRWAAMEADAELCTYLLEQGTNVLGFVTLRFAEDSLNISEMAVGTDSFRRPHLSAMISWVVMVAEHDDLRITAWVTEKQLPIFLHVGFETASSENSTYSNGEKLVLVEYKQK